MINFAFGTLGSVVFWAIYIIISSFIATALLKYMAKETFSFLVGGDKHCTEFADCDTYDDDCDALHPYVCYVFITILYFLIWPVLLLLVFFRFIIPNVILPTFRKMVITIDKVTPTIEFGKKEKTGDKNI